MGKKISFELQRDAWRGRKSKAGRGWGKQKRLNYIHPRKYVYSRKNCYIVNFITSLFTFDSFKLGFSVLSHVPHQLYHQCHHYIFRQCSTVFLPDGRDAESDVIHKNAWKFVPKRNSLVLPASNASSSSNTSSSTSSTITSATTNNKEGERSPKPKRHARSNSMFLSGAVWSTAWYDDTRCFIFQLTQSQ